MYKKLMVQQEYVRNGLYLTLWVYSTFTMERERFDIHVGCLKNPDGTRILNEDGEEVWSARITKEVGTKEVRVVAPATSEALSFLKERFPHYVGLLRSRCVEEEGLPVRVELMSPCGTCVHAFTAVLTSGEDFPLFPFLHTAFERSEVTA